MNFLPPPDEVHPLFVHFPIALYASAFVWDTLGFLGKKPSLQNAGWWNMILAQITAAATMVTGFMADALVGHMEKPFPVYSTHGSLQIVAVLWFTAAFIFRWKYLKNTSQKVLWGYLIFLGAGVLILFYGSHLGAKLANRI